MTEFYDRMAATALRLLAQFGQTVTIRRVTGGSVNPVTGAVVSGSTVDTEATAVMQDYSLQDSARANMTETLIQKDDKKFIVAASGIPVPLLTDKIIAGGLTWNIVNVKQTNPAGTPLVYEIQGRI